MTFLRSRIRQNAGRCDIARILTNAATALLSVVGFLLLSAPGLAGTIVQRKGNATLEVRFEPEQPSIALSDTIVATLTIEGSAGLKVTPPRRGPASAKWLLVDATKPEVVAAAPGRVRWQQSYRCAPREPGAIPFVFPEVAIRDGDSSPEIIAFDPLAFTVTTEIVEPDRKTLRDRVDIETSSAPSADEEASALWWLSGAALPLLGIAIILLRRFLTRRPIRSPRERALYEWRRLLAMQLPERGRRERFVTLLTLLLRDYLERDLDLPVRKQTTREFLHAVSERSSFQEDELRFLAEFLGRADAVKFAHVEASAEECHAWAEQLRHFLEARGQNSTAKSGQASKTSPVQKSGQSG